MSRPPVPPPVLTVVCVQCPGADKVRHVLAVEGCQVLREVSECSVVPLQRGCRLRGEALVYHVGGSALRQHFALQPKRGRIGIPLEDLFDMPATRIPQLCKLPCCSCPSAFGVVGRQA